MHHVTYDFSSNNNSNYDNPCEILSAFVTSGTCPTQLQAHGLPCTCPFNPTNINLPPSVYHVAQVNAAWQWLATVSQNVFMLGSHYRDSRHNQNRSLHRGKLSI